MATIFDVAERASISVMLPLGFAKKKVPSYSKRKCPLWLWIATNISVRISGYRQALVDNDNPVDEGVIVKGDYQFGSGYKKAKESLSSPNSKQYYFIAAISWRLV